MTDDENKTDTPAPSAGPSTTASGDTSRPAVATEKKAAKSGGSGASSDTAARPDQAGKSTTPPPKSFWWRAILMIAVVIFLFSTVRELADRQKSTGIGTRVPAPPTPYLAPRSAFNFSLPGEEKVTIEQAPSLPREESIPPPPGFYYSPSPTNAKGVDGGDGTTPPPRRGYSHPNQAQSPGYPSQYPWDAPYPPTGYGYAFGLAGQTSNNSGR